MRLARYRGLLVVAIWQAVPLPLKVDSTGRLQVSFGLGAGEYEVVSRSCEGDALDTSSESYRGAGAQLDAWPDPRLRVTGTVSALRKTEFDGTERYYSGTIAYEGQYFGVGGGVVHVGPDDDWIAPYLRIGNRDGLHFRTEAFPTSPPFATAGLFRAGLGYNLGVRHGVAGQAGVALCHLDCSNESNAVAFGELIVPLGPRVDLELRGVAGPGERHGNTGIALGGRVHLVK